MLLRYSPRRAAAGRRSPASRSRSPAAVIAVPRSRFRARGGDATPHCHLSPALVPDNTCHPRGAQDGPRQGEDAMEAPYILHMLGPLKHVSPFDVNMALDAGFNSVVPYSSVE